MNSKEIRQKFLDFFEKNGHKIALSSSLIPDDSSVLLTTAGMQQFKPYYLGEKSPYGDRMATIQKCFRTSDIEEVGDDSHLTFFEMLGNFSFNGNYFKKETIGWAYGVLEKEMKISENKIYATVFEGDKDTPFDKESYSALKVLGFADDKI
ncbi:MAG: alanine--tRNA ligase-related protein [Patescibacteria group bacterium]